MNKFYQLFRLEKRSTILSLIIITSLLAISFTGNGQVNLALTATPTSSGGGSGLPPGGYGPQNFNDGVIAASVSCTSSDQPWGWVGTGGSITYTWPAAESIGKVVFYKSNRPMTSCTVQYWDGSSFVNIMTYAGTTCTQDSISFSTVSTTILRFLNVAGSSNPNFREIQVFGATNTAPTFVNGAYYSIPTAICANSGALDITSYLHVNDTDASQTETWSQSVAPDNGGTLSFSSATAASGSADITPGGTITYTPGTGFAGTENFTISVSDGTATATIAMSVTVNALPAIAATSTSICSGSNTTLTATGGSTYSWAPSADLSAATGAGVVANPTVTTIYTITGSDGSCSNTVLDTLTVNDLPTVTPGTPLAICAGTTTAILPYTSSSISVSSTPDSLIYTGGMQTYTVPTGVTSILVDVRGASGGLNSQESGYSDRAGNGGRVQSALAVTPGQVLNIFVGGKGGDATGPTGGAGGFNGGANGSHGYSSYSGGGAGGASDIRIGGTALTNRVVVAGGGGGAGLDCGSNRDRGGDGGDLAAEDGQDCTVGAAGGKGGTQLAGGDGGIFAGYPSGAAGTLAIGGDAPAGTAGGGGGGGYYGGGGGSWAGGGGGSSYTDPAIASAVVHTLGYNNSNGYVIITPVSTKIYSIVWDATAADSGLINVSNNTLPDSNINISIPAGVSPGTYTGTLTISNSTCTSIGQPISVTVKPIPNVVISIPSQSVCNNAATTHVTFSDSVGGATYAWSNNNTSIGLAATGADSVGSFTVTNSGTTAQTATITVTPTANGCVGTAQDFTIIAKPTPTVDASADQSLCKAATTTLVTFGGAVSGTAFNWTNSNTSIGLGASGSTTVPAFTATNTGSSSVTGNIIVIPSANGCTGTSDTFSITVKPTPTVNAIADQSLCNGFTTNAVTMGGAVSGTTYNWTNSNTTIGLGASNNGNIAAFTATNTGATAHVATIIVTPSANSCTGTSDTFTITVKPTPTINTVSNQSLCNAATTTAVTFGGAVSGTTYAWANDNTAINLATTGTGNIAAFTATNTGSSSITGNIVITPSANGCTGSTGSFSITVKPTPTVNAVADQLLCNTATTTAVTFGGAVSSTTYTWANDNTGIDLASTGTGNIAAFIATNTGSSAITSNITVTPSANSCTGTAGTFAITVKPTPTVNSVSNQSICNTATTTAVTFGGAVSGTAFDWTNDNTLIGLGASGSATVDAFTATNSGSTSITGNITVTPSANGCTGSDGNFSITVKPTPTVDAVSNQTVCNEATTAAVTFGGNVTGTSYAWSNDNTAINLATTGTGNIAAFTATNTGATIIAGNITVTPSANSCTGAAGTFSITVNPTPTVDAVADQTVCNGANTTQVNYTGAVNGTTFNWVSSSTATGIAASGTDSVISFTATNPGTATIFSVITATPVANSCTGNTTSFQVNVNPTPTVHSIVSQAICNGSPVAAVAFTAADGSTSVTAPTPATTFSWTNSDTTIGLDSAGTGNIGSFTGINNTDTIKTATVIVVPTAGGCVGESQAFTIIVYPTPVVAAIASQVLCNTVPTAAVIFAGAVAGTTYSWTNTDTTIGLAATGNDNIASFTANNSGIAPVIATVTVLPAANTCQGATQSFTFTVNPTPVIDTIASQTLCNTFPTTTVNFTGAVAGTTYSWTNSNTLIGLGASGNDSVGSFTATNIANVLQTAIITVTPSANGCTGASRDFTINVNPTPDVDTIASQVLCNTFATATVNFTGSVALTSFAWTNSDTTIGLTANGTGVISSFTASDTTSANVIATITVTPSANTCIGASRSFSITVNPTPTVAPVASQALCNTFTTATVNFVGTVAGTTYGWTNTDTSIGIAATGADSIGSFTATDATNAPNTATITVTPTANTCVGTTQNFTYTVNPTPSVDSVANQVFCNGAATSTLYFTGSVAGSLYSWTNTNTSINLAAAGTDSSGTFIAINTGNAPQVATVTITPSANGCTGAADSFTYIINPTPSLTSALTETVCSGLPFTYTPTGAVTGSTFTWNRATVSGISPAGISGVTDINETLVNSTLHSINVVYAYITTANGCVRDQNVTLTVNPAAPVPVIAAHPSASLCAQTMYQNFGAANAPVDSVIYTWSASNATVFASGTSEQYALVNFNNAGNAVVTLDAHVSGISCITRDTFAVSVGTDVSTQPTVIYFAGEFACIPSDNDTYQWGYDDLQLDSTIVTGAINQDYVLASPLFGTRFYWVITTKNGCAQKTYYTAPTAVQHVASGQAYDVQLYPNPSSETVTVKYTGPNDGVVIAEIYTLLGQRVMSMPMSDNKAVMTVSSLASGSYLVNCYRNGVRIATSRMVKN